MVENPFSAGINSTAAAIETNKSGLGIYISIFGLIERSVKMKMRFDQWTMIAAEI